MLESCCTYLLKLLSYSWKVKCCTVYQWRGGGGTTLFGLTVAMFGPMVYRDTYTYGEFKSSTGCTISLFDVLNRVWTLAVRGLHVLYHWDQFLETESFLILGYQMSLILVFNTIAKWIAWDTWFLSFFLCLHFLSIKLQLNRFKIQPSWKWTDGV